MIKVYRLAFYMLVLAVLFTMSACASKKDRPEISDKTVTVGEHIDVPEFYLNPPISKETFYGVGSGKTKRLDLSRKISLSRARDDIAFQIQAQVKASITDYAQEGGEGDNSQLVSFIETVSKQIADTTLTGTTTEKVTNGKDGTIYSLISYPKANILKTAKETFSRNEDAAFAEFKAQEAVRRLEAQLNNNPTTAGQAPAQ